MGEVTTTTNAIKYDQDKIRMDLLPIGPLTEIAKVLTFGATKYSDENWRQGFSYKRVYGALLRHTFLWIRGEDKDPETGLSHMAHAGCCILFILEFILHGTGKDDRYIYTKVEDDDGDFKTYGVEDNPKEQPAVRATGDSTTAHARAIRFGTHRGPSK